MGARHLIARGPQLCDRIGQDLQMHRRARVPIRRHLQRGRPRQAAMGEKCGLGKAHPTRLGNGRKGHAGDRPQVGIRIAQGKGHQSGTRRDQIHAELTRDVKGNPRGPHFRDRRPAGRHNQMAGRGTGGEETAIAMLNRSDLGGQGQMNATFGAFIQQHRHHLPRGPVTKQLAQCFLMPGDAVPLNQSQKIPLRVTTECRFGEMRILADIAGGFDAHVGEIAPAAARNQDLFAGLFRVIHQQHTRAALAASGRRQKASAAGAKDNHIIFHKAPCAHLCRYLQA